MNGNANKNNRYLPTSVGIEVESCSPMMVALKSKLRNFFPSGNSESNAIYECQTVPVYTNKPLDVVLLGEVTRRCIPNYVKGGSDIASCSAHAHIVGFKYTPEEEHTEALMVGLMPFLSMTWNKPKLAGYTFRASVVGMGSRYSRFRSKALQVAINGDNRSSFSYTGRGTWVKDQGTRHRAPSVEVRANENSPLWLYFITPLLNNQDMVDKLRAMGVSSELVTIYKKTENGSAPLDVYTDFIESVKGIVIPFLLDSIPGILENFEETDRVFMEEILTAYLTEDIKKYDSLVDTLISGDAEVAEFFKTIESEYKTQSKKFNVVKEVK